MSVELIRPSAFLALLADATAAGGTEPGSLTRLGRRLAARVAATWRYRVTLHQLQRRDDRELADLGLARAELRAVARAHARAR